MCVFSIEFYIGDYWTVFVHDGTSQMAFLFTRSFCAKFYARLNIVPLSLTHEHLLSKYFKRHKIYNLHRLINRVQ